MSDGHESLGMSLGNLGKPGVDGGPWGHGVSMYGVRGEQGGRGTGRGWHDELFASRSQPGGKAKRQTAEQMQTQKVRSRREMRVYLVRTVPPCLPCMYSVHLYTLHYERALSARLLLAFSRPCCPAIPPS